MKALQNFGDVRNERACCHCGDLFLSEGVSLDHVPSKILLDDPLPANLHLAWCCKKCNNALSSDEEYVACMLDCTLAGTTELAKLGREKVRKALAHSPKLRAHIEGLRVNNEQGTYFNPDRARVRRVALKLARGHASYELNEPKPEAPDQLLISPIPLLSERQREQFEASIAANIWPEVGSRKMQSIVEGEGSYDDWTIVQEGRYRYLTSVAEGLTVRCVLSEHLAIEVHWS
ncbi:MAG: hypothetical protein ACOH13_10945 [Flavobacteriales bacterium]